MNISYKHLITPCMWGQPINYLCCDQHVVANIRPHALLLLSIYVGFFKWLYKFMSREICFRFYFYHRWNMPNIYYIVLLPFLCVNMKGQSDYYYSTKSTVHYCVWCSRHLQLQCLLRMMSRLKTPKCPCTQICRVSYTWWIVLVVLYKLGLYLYNIWEWIPSNHFTVQWNLNHSLNKTKRDKEISRVVKNIFSISAISRVIKKHVLVSAYASDAWWSWSN